VVTAPRPPALLIGYGLLTEPAIPRAIKHLADSTELTARPKALTHPQAPFAPLQAAAQAAAAS
jgi:hypothetical protein